ncbi:MAG: helix-turn-helix domain-containing protein [Clostridia bacterium]|nr:helix-turn-helix domain-containing protein [Clostridia bacterium]
MTIETANRLYELRKKQGLSQEELAEKLGVSRQAVSKWERSEASPDTDNLIALAKIYGLSLDELVYGKKNDEQSTETESEVKKGTNKIDIGPTGIFLESDDGDKMHINLRGIKVTEGKTSIHISDGGEDDFDDYEKELIVKSKGKARIWLELPYPIICTIAYLLCGFLDLLGGWHPAWIIFVTIPVYYTLVEAIYARRFSTFAYPVLTAVIYLIFGCYFGNWHPSWIIFVTVPVYYSIASALDKKIHGEAYDDEGDDDEDDED